MTDCPNSCHCSVETMGTGVNSYSVNCAYRKLTNFPQATPILTTKLNITGNMISQLVIPQEAIGSFSEIKILDASNNILEYVDAEFFNAFPKLEYLYLKGNKLTEIPFPLPTTLRVLHVGFNMLTSVTNLDHLHELRELYLGQNRIHDDEIILQDRKGNDTELTNLKVIDLSGNYLRKMTIKLFNVVPKLQHLSLANNTISDFTFLQKLGTVEVLDLRNTSISKLDDGIFLGMSRLRYLSLAFNNFTTLPKELPTLEWLDVSFNNISKLNEESKNDLYPHDVILLGGNPFHCDCHLVWLKDFYDVRVYLLKYVDVSTEKYIPMCLSPEQLKGKSWNSIDSTEFVCEEKERNKDAPQSGTSAKAASWIADLHANYVGPNYVKLRWTPFMWNSIASEVILAYRKFGKEKSWTEISITANVGLYTIHNLEAATAYAVCIKRPGGISHEHSCIDVWTGDKRSDNLLYVVWIVVLLLSLLVFFMWLYCSGRLNFSKINAQKKQR